MYILAKFGCKTKNRGYASKEEVSSTINTRQINKTEKDFEV